MNSEIHKFGIQFQQFLSSFDQQSARDIDTRVPSSFKCTFTLLIFRPHSPSFSFFAKLLLTWLEMKKCNFQEEGKSPRLPAQWLVPISAAVLHDLTLSPSQAVQVLYLHKKKEVKCSYFINICNNISLIYVTEHRWKNTILLCPRHKPSKFYIFRKGKKSSVHISLIYVKEHRWKNTISLCAISSQKE